MLDIYRRPRTLMDQEILWSAFGIVPGECSKHYQLISHAPFYVRSGLITRLSDKQQQSKRKLAVWDNEIAARSENHWLFRILEIHFNVQCPCISQSSFDQHLLCIFSNDIMMCRGRIKNRKLYIWPIFTCVDRTFDTGHSIHVNWLPLRGVCSRNSVYFVVRFPLSDERSWATWQENSIGTDHRRYTGQVTPGIQPFTPCG